MGHSCPKAPGEGSSVKPDWECCHGTGIPRSSQDTHTHGRTISRISNKGERCFLLFMPRKWDLHSHLSVMRLGGGVEMAPICATRWWFPHSPSLSCRFNRGGIRLGRGLGLQVRKEAPHLIYPPPPPPPLLPPPPPPGSHGCVCVLRSRAVVSAEASMDLTPRVLNPDDRQCHLPQTDIMATW